MRIFMNTFFNSLTVLRNLKDNKLIRAVAEYAVYDSAENFNDLLYEVYAAGAENNLLSAVQSAILHDENAFSLCCAKGEKPSDYLKKAYLSDLKSILSAVLKLKNESGFNFDKPLPVFNCAEQKLVDNLEKFYAKKGYGQFIDGKAFSYTEGGFLPLDGTADTTLSQLKNYENEKALIEANVKNFVENLPYSHMLLYGDRGTGKSSTVHAMLNAYCDRGLRLVELDKNDLTSIKKIKRQLATLPLKFIIFIDDLTFAGQDEKVSSLKSAVEGTVVDCENVMIVATSNRRHVIKESISDRENAVHPSDNIEEELSLSDRFGLTVMFSSTDKAGYLSIVKQLADDLSLTTPRKQLEELAERWAIMNGGRSPRRAKQFADFIYACEKSGRPVEF